MRSEKACQSCVDARWTQGVSSSSGVWSGAFVCPASSCDNDAAGRAVFLHDLFRKLKRRSLVSLRRHHSLQDLAFMIDGAPEISELAVDLHTSSKCLRHCR